MRILTGSQGLEALQIILSPTALKIVRSLSKGAMKAEKISEEIGNPLSTTYRELEKLRKVGVVERSVQPELAATGRSHYRYTLAIDGVDTETITLVLSNDYLRKLLPIDMLTRWMVAPLLPPEGYTGPQALRIVKFVKNNLNRRILQELAHAPLYARAIAERLGAHESVIVRRLHQFRKFEVIEPVGGLSKQGRPAKCYTLKGGVGAKLILIPADIGPYKEHILVVKKPKKSLFTWGRKP